MPGRPHRGSAATINPSTTGSGPGWLPAEGWRRNLLVFVVVLLSVTATQASQTQALTVTSAAVTFPAVTLDGTQQTASGSTSAWRVDATGETGAGTSPWPPPISPPHREQSPSPTSPLGS